MEGSDEGEVTLKEMKDTVLLLEKQMVELMYKARPLPVLLFAPPLGPFWASELDSIKALAPVTKYCL